MTLRKKIWKSPSSKGVLISPFIHEDTAYGTPCQEKNFVYQRSCICLEIFLKIS